MVELLRMSVYTDMFVSCHRYAEQTPDKKELMISLEIVKAEIFGYFEVLLILF